MNLLMFLTPAPGILLAGICFLLLRRRRIADDKRHSELLSMIEWQRAENTQQIAQLTRSVEILERTQHSVEEAAGGLTRSHRSQAMQLLRSGMSPETVASSVGLAAREMRLMAKVSRILCVFRRCE